MGNVLTAMPPVAPEGTYRMGPLLESSAADFLWNAQLPDGTLTACSEPVGWESLEYITPLDQAGGRDGALTGPQSVAPRLLDIQGLVVSPDTKTLHGHLQRLRRITGPQGLPGPRQQIVWEQFDYGVDQRLALITRPTGSLEIKIIPGWYAGGVAAQVVFQLVAANPVWKLRAGAVESAQVGLPQVSGATGRTYDKTYDYNYGAGTNPGGEMVVVNQGNLDTWPVFYITGPAATPIITNVTTGQEFAVIGDIVAGQTVTVDSRSGVVTPASFRLAGRPFPLAPGGNTIRWRRTDSVYDPAALLRLEWRSTWT